MELPRSMRAFEIDPGAGKGTLAAVERPVPRPGPGEILMRVGAASINYRDLLIRQNFYGAAAGRLIPLSDGAGQIVEVGQGVSQSRIDERVVGAFFPDWIGGAITAERRARSLGANMDGMLAEYAVLPAHAAVSVPDHLTDSEAAVLPCAALTAWNALLAAERVGPGTTVVLQGSGGVSVIALQLAKLTGAQIIHMSSSGEKRARLFELGADHVIDYVVEPDWPKAVMKITAGRGADLVVDVGGPGTINLSARAVKVGGTIASVGFVSEGPGLDPKLVIGRSIRVIGITVGSCDQLRDMNGAIAARGLRPVVDRTLPFERASEAYDLMRESRQFGKITISIP